MQFFSWVDELTGVEHKYLILQMEKEKFDDMRKLCTEHIPFVSCSAVFRKEHPFVVIDYGSNFGGFLKTAIPLDEVFLSGEALGEKLEVGDVLTVILTAHPQDKVITISKKKISFNVSPEEVIACSFRYTEEMDAIHTFYKLLQRLESNSAGAIGEDVWEEECQDEAFEESRP